MKSIFKYARLKVRKGDDVYEKNYYMEYLI